MRKLRQHQRLHLESGRVDTGALRIRHATEMAQVFFRVDPSANGREGIRHM